MSLFDEQIYKDMEELGGLMDALRAQRVHANRKRIADHINKARELSFITGQAFLELRDGSVMLSGSIDTISKALEDIDNFRPPHRMEPFYTYLEECVPMDNEWSVAVRETTLLDRLAVLATVAGLKHSWLSWLLAPASKLLDWGDRR